jgi:hypothetical protein
MPVPRRAELLVRYFLYSVSPQKELELLQSFDTYNEAKRAAVAARMAQTTADDNIVKIIFAQDPAEAAQLLQTKRERQPSEDD